MKLTTQAKATAKTAFGCCEHAGAGGGAHRVTSIVGAGPAHRAGQAGERGHRRGDALALLGGELGQGGGQPVGPVGPAPGEQLGAGRGEA